eukprot:m.120310 g.120310  ORF g.120310 m.120310 type:complete len:51 (-) comp16499_c0_seq1:818-970(-)
MMTTTTMITATVTVTVATERLQQAAQQLPLLVNNPHRFFAACPWGPLPMT